MQFNKKDNKKKKKKSQTYSFFFSVYIESRQNDFVLHNKEATVFFK